MIPLSAYHPHVILLPQLFLLLSVPHIVTLTEVWSTQLLSALPDFIKQVQLLHLFNQLLILSLLDRYFLLLKLHLSLILFLISRISVELLKLFDEGPALHAPRSTQLPDSVPNQIIPEPVVTPFSCLEANQQLTLIQHEKESVH